MTAIKSLGTVFLVLTMALAARTVSATIYYSKKEAMELAFGKGAAVEVLSIFLTDSQIAAVEKMAEVKLESKLYSFYSGKREGAVLGYAAIESHNVRTKPETLMILLTASGELDGIHVLAFHEPPDYQPPERWFARLYGRRLEELELNRGVDAISGATLSTRAALASVRKVIALYQVAIAQRGQ